MKILYSRDALKFLAKLNQKSVDRIRSAIKGLTKTPPQGDIKTLQGFSDGRQRLRVGNWRVVYRYESDTGLKILSVIDIGNRGDIYK